MDIIILGKFTDEFDNANQCPKVEGDYYFAHKYYGDDEKQMVLSAYRKINNKEDNITLERSNPIENAKFKNVFCLNENYIELFENEDQIVDHKNIKIKDKTCHLLNYKNEKIIIYSREVKESDKIITICDVLKWMKENNYIVNNVYVFLYSVQTRPWLPNEIKSKM